MKKKMYLTFIIGVLLDQLTKFLVAKNITNVTIVPNLLSFIYTENKGAAFSILSNKQIFIIIISIILLLVLINMYKKDYLKNKDNSLYNIMYGMIFGGIIGNLLDRIIRGYVVDFILVKVIIYYFPVFNLADVFITLGVVFLIIYMLKNNK